MPAALKLAVVVAALGLPNATVPGPLDTFARGSLLGGLDALIARIRMRLDLPLEFVHHRLSRRQMSIKRLLAPE